MGSAAVGLTSNMLVSALAIRYLMKPSKLTPGSLLRTLKGACLLVPQDVACVHPDGGLVKEYGLVVRESFT